MRALPGPPPNRAAAGAPGAPVRRAQTARGGSSEGAHGPRRPGPTALPSAPQARVLTVPHPPSAPPPAGKKRTKRKKWERGAARRLPLQDDSPSPENADEKPGGEREPPALPQPQPPSTPPAPRRGRLNGPEVGAADFRRLGCRERGVSGMATKRLARYAKGLRGWVGEGGRSWPRAGHRGGRLHPPRPARLGVGRESP